MLQTHETWARDNPNRLAFSFCVFGAWCAHFLERRCDLALPNLGKRLPRFPTLCGKRGDALCGLGAEPTTIRGSQNGQLRGDRIAERRQLSLAELTLTRIRWSFTPHKGSICHGSHAFRARSDARATRLEPSHTVCVVSSGSFSTELSVMRNAVPRSVVRRQSAVPLE